MWELTALMPMGDQWYGEGPGAEGRRQVVGAALRRGVELHLTVERIERSAGGLNQRCFVNDTIEIDREFTVKVLRGHEVPQSRLAGIESNVNHPATYRCCNNRDGRHLRRERQQRRTNEETLRHTRAAA